MERTEADAGLWAVGQIIGRQLIGGQAAGIDRRVQTDAGRGASGGTAVAGLCRAGDLLPELLARYELAAANAAATMSAPRGEEGLRGESAAWPLVPAHGCERTARWPGDFGPRDTGLGDTGLHDAGACGWPNASVGVYEVRFLRAAQGAWQC